MFYTITVDSWNDILLIFDKINDKNSFWAFRGQSDASWGLSTKFEREASKYQNDGYWYKNREKYILQDFQRKAHHYVRNLPERLIDWLSLLQHHGGPTRLLDFTYSHYISLFFAVETAVTDSAIWAVNIRKIINNLLIKMGVSEKRSRISFEEFIEDNIHWAEAIIEDRKNNEIVFLIEPFQQHERISIQQGLFLFPGDIEKSFESNICSAFDFDNKNLSPINASSLEISEIKDFDFSDSSIIKIIIPSHLNSKVLLELHKMNVTAASLFPGLDGFARSLNYRFSEIDYALNHQS